MPKEKVSKREGYFSTYSCAVDVKVVTIIIVGLFLVRIMRMRSQQEPMTWSVKLPHIPVTAFSQTDLFLV